MMNELLSALAVVTVIMLIFFGIAQYIKNNSIADVAWGMGIVAISATLFFARGTFTHLQLLVMTLVAIWGFRLTSHIGMRQWCKPEDQRYVEWRKSWGSYQVLGALIFVFGLQGSLMFVVSAPAIAVMLGELVPIGPLALIGTGMWIFGFICESIADAQLAAFLNNPQNRGRLMMDGLWHYSRHPNYFGELLMWWGIYVIALSVPYGYLSIIGPAVLTYLLLYVSGVPLAEKMLARHPDFPRYKETTSVLILFPNRR